MRQVILALLILLTVFQAYFIIDFLNVRVVEYDMQLGVENITGFNIDTDAVYFGAITPTGQGRRLIDISNGPKITRVTILTSGELSEWVYVSDNNFILEPFETRQIKVTVVVPKDAEYREYSGKIRLFLKEG